MRRALAAAAAAVLLLLASTGTVAAPVRPILPLPPGAFSLVQLPKPVYESVALPDREAPVRPRVPQVQAPVVVVATVTNGVASWYCDPPRWPRCTVGYPEDKLVAAIRTDLLGHRGERARVCLAGSKRCTEVTVVDCNCAPGANLIDLYAVAFRKLAPTDAGRIDVALEWLP